MNSTIKVAAKDAEKLTNQMRTVIKKKEGIQHKKAKLGESLKKKSESKVMHSQKYILYIQGVPGGMDKTSGECSLC